MSAAAELIQGDVAAAPIPTVGDRRTALVAASLDLRLVWTSTFRQIAGTGAPWEPMLGPRSSADPPTAMRPHIATEMVCFHRSLRRFDLPASTCCATVNTTTGFTRLRAREGLSHGGLRQGGRSVLRSGLAGKPGRFRVVA
jgi:hypothetical protein